MKSLKLITVLLALLLTAMVMVPMVSAIGPAKMPVPINSDNSITQPEKAIDANIALGITSKDIIEKNYVSLAVSQNQATEELEEVIYLKKFGNGVDWTGSTLNQNPVIVYDTNGKMLYYKFWVESSGKTIGEINVASSRTLGSPIQSVSTIDPDGFSIEKMQSRAREIISTSFKDSEIISEKVVLYDYPLTGLSVEILNKKTNGIITFVVDQNNYPDYRIIGSYLSDDNNGLAYVNNSRSRYSSLSLDEKKTNIELWNKENDRINTVTQKINSIRVQYPPASEKNVESIKNSKESEELIVSTLMIGKSTAGTRVLLRNGVFPTIFQGYGYDWCKVGTAQTITTYYYLIGRPMDNGQILPRTRTLQEIATKMGAVGTSAPPNPWVEQYYYQDPWSSGGLGMSQFLYQPYAPTLSYIQSKINSGDPLKIGTQVDISTPFGVVPAGHARACYGYDTTGSQPVVYFSDTRIAPQGQLTYEVFSQPNYNVYIGKT